MATRASLKRKLRKLEKKETKLGKMLKRTSAAADKLKKKIDRLRE